MMKEETNEKRRELTRRDCIKTSAVVVSPAALLSGTNYIFAQSAAGVGGPADQARREFGLAVWSHKLRDFVSKDEVERHAERLAEASIDILIPIVKGTHGTVDFLTSLAEVNQKYPDWDPLKVLIEACQKRGIKVHAWFCVFVEGEHSRLRREHPEFMAEGSKRWACAMRPEVQDYEFELHKSCALRYRPDGLHLDYIRTDTKAACRCEFCKGEMKKQGIDIEKVKRAEPTWTEWRASRIMEFVRRVRKFTKKEKMELSAAVSTDHVYARVIRAQDWANWLEEELVDYLFPMNYTTKVSEFTRWTKSHVALVRGRVPVWEGIGQWRLSSTEALAKHARAAHDAGAQGVVIFNYGTMMDDDFKALREVKERAVVEK